MASFSELLGVQTTPNRFRFGYWSGNLLFGGIAWLVLAPIASIAAFSGGRGDGNTVGAALIAIAIGSALVAGGSAMLRLRIRSFVEFDDTTAQVHIHSGGRHTPAPYGAVAFALPAKPSLFPANVRYQVSGGQWTSCSMLGQGQARTPSELRRLAEVLAQRGIPVHWA